jgi:NAD(P)-dependent dehydrogenase (short-subunit alcohol dehydrogenase family)
MAEGRIVVVTGGTGALGRGVTSAMVEAGYEVVVTWVVPSEREAAKAAFGDAVALREVDVVDPGAVQALVDEVDRRGGAWAVAHLVGGFRDGEPFASLDMNAWRQQFELNVDTLANVLRAVLPGMIERGGGRVVAVSSRAAVRPFAGAAAYAASKAAVIAAVQAASEEVKQAGVCVNCVLPSVIDTPANRAAMPDADHSRWVRPEEIGAVIRFLCSPEASAVTGAALPVHGRA